MRSSMLSHDWGGEISLHKSNYLEINNPPGNASKKDQILPNDLSLKSLQQFEKVGII